MSQIICFALLLAAAVTKHIPNAFMAYHAI